MKGYHNNGNFYVTLFNVIYIKEFFEVLSDVEIAFAKDNSALYKLVLGTKQKQYLLTANIKYH